MELEGIRQSIGSFHFETNVNRTNFEQVITDRYKLFTKIANYEKMEALHKDFYDIHSDVGLFHSFQSTLMSLFTMMKKHMWTSKPLFGKCRISSNELY